MEKTTLNLIFLGAAYIGKTATCDSILKSFNASLDRKIIATMYAISSFNYETYINRNKVTIKIQLVELPSISNFNINSTHNIGILIDALKTGTNVVIIVDSCILNGNVIVASSLHTTIRTYFRELFHNDLINNTMIITTYSDRFNGKTYDEIHNFYDTYCKRLHNIINSVKPTVSIPLLPVYPMDNKKDTEELVKDCHELIDKIVNRWVINPYIQTIDTKPKKTNILTSIWNNIVGY